MATTKSKKSIKDYVPVGIVILVFSLAVYPSIVKTYIPKWAPAEKVIEKETIVEKIVRQTPTVSVNTIKVMVDSVTDGDTIHASLQLPLNTTLVNQRVRCLGYDAYELSELNGLEAKNELASLLQDGEVFGMTGDRAEDNFGRVLLTLYVRKQDKVISVAKWMEEHKFTKPLKAKLEDEQPTTEEE